MFLGYESGTKAYRLYDPIQGKVLVSRDVVFDEATAWRWEEAEAREGQGGGIRDSFTVEHMEVHGDGEVAGSRPVPARAAGTKPPAAAEAEEPPSPGGAGDTDVQGSMGVGSPVSPAQRTPAAATIDYASPTSNVSEFVDAFHEGEEVRFHKIDNVIEEAEVPGLAARGLGGDVLLLMSAEEPTTFVVAEHDAAWQKAMLEEMEAIEQNGT